ncbi:malonyl-CoA decarboxylase [Zavarzinia compransoris]|uniref:MCD, Malonyl-CoA decarboxylase MCD n=1 Tax=Zavarzinia compransoris TaxID=1264899 RepID=A0A317E1D2_9PROT|nr:malonyl-CoA decarboxylase [Zavarzinia compransoris]PWR20769.1 MCD, Malonyl-CoA decarboxylase MCD [Zavarzinia compransoris]TDP44398.1 malonyl-CoA decarboxylase [Zavarzinia compransoris]
MSTTDFFRNMMDTISRRGRHWFTGREATLALPAQFRPDFAALVDALLSGRGEASGVARAREILEAWQAVDDGQKRDFFTLLAESYGPRADRLDKAIADYKADPGLATQAALHRAAEPRRQDVLRRLNLAPGGIATLVRMREHLLGIKRGDAALEALDDDFAHLFASWFNRGFLVLERIDWSTPANILERIIAYEAVHQIHDWNDLRRRLAPPDRRLYAFFHPQLVDDPLIFVEVALAGAIPGNIQGVLAEGRDAIDPKAATTAVFYSISNCQEGLRGISFGNFLIKQVVEDLRRELPGVTTFVTLSPVPGFSRWLKEMRADEGERSDFLTSADRMVLQALDRADWTLSPALAESVNAVLARVTAHYMLRARTRDGRVIDPVARFHLGNGARLEAIHPLGDRSTNGMRQSYGVMVNYLYDLDHIEANHEALATRGEVVAAPAVHALLAAPDTPAPAQGGGRFRIGGFSRTRGEGREKEARS